MSKENGAAAAEPASGANDKPILDLSQFQSEQTKQYAQLMNELGRVLRTDFASLADKQQQTILGHAADIAKLSDEIKDLKQDQTARFQQHLADYQAGGSYRGPFRSAAAAKQFGEFAGAVLQKDYARVIELQKAAMLPTSGPAGGYLMPDLLIQDLVRNVEEAGVFEANCPAMPVPVLKGGVAKRTSGLTVYYPDYGVAGTASTPAMGKSQFNCKREIAGVEVEDWMLASDLAIPLANYVVTELAYALALADDTNYFVGTGTSAYNGYTGLFKSGMTGMADLSLQKVDGDSGDDTLAELIAKTTYYLGAMLGKLPLWAHKQEPKWYGHASIFFAYLGSRSTTGEPLVANILASAGGVPGFSLMGLPFVPVQVAPTATAVSTVFLLLASLKAGCAFVRHQAGIRFRTNDSLKFWEGLTIFAADVAQDMVVKDGNAVVQLKTAAS